MPEMILPGVYIEVRPEALIVPGAITVGNIGIVGTAAKGPLGKPIILGSYADAQETFGNYDPWIDGKSNELTLIRALQQAYNNGASTVIAVRISSTENNGTAENKIAEWNTYTKARKASIELSNADGTSAILKAKTHGTWGNDIQMNVWDATEDSFITKEEQNGPGPITLARHPIVESARNRIEVDKAATGETKVYKLIYTGTPASGQVLIDQATGELTFHAGPPDQAPVAGDKLRASYAVDKTVSRKVILRYGLATEEYTIADGNHLVAEVKTRESPLVEAIAGTASTKPPDKFLRVDEFHAFGTGSGTPGNNGKDATDADYKLGLNQLLNEDAHIIVAAGMDNETIGDELQSHCEVASTDKIKRDRIAVVGSKVSADFDSIRGHNLASDRIIFVAPGIKTTDAASGKPVILPGAYAAAAVAGMLSARDPHISLTNKIVFSVADISTGSTVATAGREPKFTPSQLEQLVQARVLVLEDRQGIRIVKGITPSTNTAWHQITIRRIVDYAKYGVRSAANSYIGLLNNDRVRKTLKGSINGFLAGMVDDEMLVSYELDVTATRDEEIRGIVKVTLTLQPTCSIDFIKVVMFLG